MIILGVDTSLRSTGYGVIETCGSRLLVKDYGNISNGHKVPISQCLSNIHAKITALIEVWKPDVVSVEKVIYGKNANTMMVLGEARGAVIVAAADAGLPIYEYEPRRMKQAVCGNGMAEKLQIQRMIKTLLNLTELPQNDAADALGLAICHTHQKPLLTQEENRV